MSLSPEERDRYLRHLLLREVGGQGQRALKAAKVLVIGAGGLGCPILQYLTMAGIGTIGICDADTVSLSNLQRQTLYTTDDVGKLKVDRAVARLSQMNPHVIFHQHPVYLTEENAADLIAPYDLIIEGLDRYAPRYVLNKACLEAGKPFLSAAIGRFDGQVALFAPGQDDHPCYACLVPAAPDDEALCETEGVLGAVPGVVGSLAAMEAIKLICRIAPSLHNTLLIYQGFEGTIRRVTVPKDPGCPVCGVT